MAKKSTYVELGKRKFEISNLEKILYPDDDILKAEVIEYYLKLAPTILTHLKGRPLTLIRFPDGIHGEQFYQKNRPDWAPDWVDSVQLGREKTKDYILAGEEAVLVWLANLACIEIHQMHSRRPHFDHPDYIVYDLDPPEGYKFYKLVDLAMRLRDHLSGYGYNCFVKTTGGKGLHIITPIETNYSHKEAFEAAKSLVDPFINSNKDATLHIKKESRKGRVLIDIYRNRQSQSIISAYSLRGVPGALVSMPISWNTLEMMDSPREFDFQTVMNLLDSKGDEWEGISAWSVPLHTSADRKKKEKSLPASGYYKSPEQLNKYSKKRDFDKTPEPGAEVSSEHGVNFVIHRHAASHLHYDLRLEQDGVLKSWAIPRGLPPRPGVKRLAVQTEDHPMKYLDFEGEIPKGQYGGGSMWVFARGKYDITKTKKEGFYFYLHSPQVTAEFRIHQMKGKEWLLERVDTPQKDWSETPPEFMLASASSDVPNGDNMGYEVKWDGIRTFVCVNEGEVSLYSRSGRNITSKFPELTSIPRILKSESAVFDAEIVNLDKSGKPDFKKVIQRLQKTNEGDIARSSKRNPSLCILFDCLYLDGRLTVNEPLFLRREWLKTVVKKETPFRISDMLDEGEELFEAAKEHGLEGIMAKDKTSIYQPGKRSPSWVKVKVRNTSDCLILGFTEGKGNRSAAFGALHIAENMEGNWVYRGKVGTGFNDKLQKDLMKSMEDIQSEEPVFDFDFQDEKISTWIKPLIWCEVQYAMITKNETYREPVFIRLRPDLTSSDL